MKFRQVMGSSVDAHDSRAAAVGMAVLLAAVASLPLGMGVASAQGVPPSMINPQYGVPWTAEELARHGRVADNQTVIPKAVEHLASSAVVRTPDK